MEENELGRTAGENTNCTVIFGKNFQKDSVIIHASITNSRLALATQVHETLNKSNIHHLQKR